MAENFALWKSIVRLFRKHTFRNPRKYGIESTTYGNLSNFASVGQMGQAA